MRESLKPASGFSQLSLELICRYSARVLAGGLFLVWGAFFVEHVGGWMFQPEGLPPVWVQGVLACHFLLLISLVAGWFREIEGGIAVILCTALFFGPIAGSHLPVYFYMAGTAVPGVLWLISGYLARKKVALTAS